MNMAYVDGKVREALAAAKGSPAMAQKILMTWATQDPTLLLGMAQPFLKAIAGAAIQNAGRREEPARRRGPATATTGVLSREALESVLSQMGGGDDDGGSRGGRPQAAPARPVAPASPGMRKAPTEVDHEKSMLTIAKAFATKKMR